VVTVLAVHFQDIQHTAQQTSHARNPPHRGHPSLRKPQRCTSSNAWPKSIAARVSLPTRSARNSVDWRTRSGESTPHSSFPTVGFVSRKTHAAAVTMWDSVWENKKWLTQTWCGAPEQKILVGVTSLITRLGWVKTWPSPAP
jgi:hypothetical protein